jgi:membrane protease YdiL (CAAX protease family)
MLLGLFYAIVYGSPLLLGSVAHRVLSPALSALAIGTIMLAAAQHCTGRDIDRQRSLGLGPLPLGRAVGWSLLGFLGTYAASLALTLAYVALRGDIRAVASQRVNWLGRLAELPLEQILPLALFAGLWEEVVFRGVVLGRLRAALSPADDGGSRRSDPLAVLLTALLFGLGHGYQGLLGILQTALAGCVLGGLVVWRRSLWPAVGAHLGIDLFGLLALRLLKTMLP